MYYSKYGLHVNKEKTLKITFLEYYDPLLEFDEQ